MPDSISQPSDPQEVNSSVCWKPCHPKQEVLSGAVDWLDYFRVTCSVYLTSTIMLGSKLLLHIVHSLAEIPVSPFILGFPPFLSSIRPLHFTMCCPTLLSPIFPIALPTLQWWREGGCNKMLFADSAKTEAVWHPATHGTHMTCRWQRVEEKVLDSPWPPSSTPFPSLSLSLSLSATSSFFHPRCQSFWLVMLFLFFQLTRLTQRWYEPDGEKKKKWEDISMNYQFWNYCPRAEISFYEAKVNLCASYSFFFPSE